MKVVSKSFHMKLNTMLTMLNMFYPMLSSYNVLYLCQVSLTRAPCSQS